jgi:hypothetical protein
MNKKPEMYPLAKTIYKLGFRSMTDPNGEVLWQRKGSEGLVAYIWDRKHPAAKEFSKNSEYTIALTNNGHLIFSQNVIEIDAFMEMPTLAEICDNYTWLAPDPVAKKAGALVHTGKFANKETYYVQFGGDVGNATLTSKFRMPPSTNYNGSVDVLCQNYSLHSVLDAVREHQLLHKKAFEVPEDIYAEYANGDFEPIEDYPIYQM